MVSIVGGDTGSAIDMAIDSFTPHREVRSWDTTAEFVRTSVRRADPFNVRKAREHLMIAAPYVDFCYLQHGLELDNSLWQPELADVFLTAWGKRRAPRTVAASRSQLNDLIRRVNTDPDMGPTRRSRYRSRPNAPYTDPEIAGLFGWANTRRVRRVKRTAHGILALGLGLGLGLDAGTMTAVTGRHFTDHGHEGIEFAYENRFGWCDADFEDDLRTILLQRPTSSRVLEFGGTTTLTSFLAASRKASRPLDALVPEVDRLRATWFVRRATHFSALRAVMDAYGIRHTSTLQSVFARLPQPTETQIRHTLRTKGTR